MFFNIKNNYFNVFLCPPHPFPSFSSNSPYQTQYQKNLDLLKMKYRKGVSSEISMNEVAKCVVILEEDNEYFIYYYNLFYK